MMWKKYVEKFNNTIKKALIAAYFFSKYILLSKLPGDRIYLTINDIKYGTNLRRDRPPLFETVYADPENITQIARTEGILAYDFRRVGYIGTEDFLSDSVDLKEYHLFHSIYNHFVHGEEWSETTYYNRAMDNLNSNELGWRKFDSESDVVAYFDRLDELHESIDSSGYLTNERAKSANSTGLVSVLMGPIWAHDEVTVNIGADGSLHLLGGRHRTSVAKSLSLEAIPVRVIARHVEWCRFRSELLQATRTGKRSTSKHQLFHPDLQRVESKYDSKAIAESIRDQIDLSERVVIELNPGVSCELLIDLAPATDELIAIQENGREYLQWYAEFRDETVETETNLESSPKGCVVIALEPYNEQRLSEFLREFDNPTVITNSGELGKESSDDRIVQIENIHRVVNDAD